MYDLVIGIALLSLGAHILTTIIVDRRKKRDID